MNVSHSHLLSFPRRIRLPSHRRGQCEGASAAACGQLRRGSIWLAELRRQSGLIRVSAIDAADLSGADQLYLVGLHHSFRQKALRRVGLKEQVTLIGARDHLEIWDQQQWEQYLEEHLLDHEQMLLKAREEAMRRERETAGW